MCRPLLPPGHSWRACTRRASRAPRSTNCACRWPTCATRRCSSSAKTASWLTRFALEEQQGNEVVQRVGALEVSLPKLLEALARRRRYRPLIADRVDRRRRDAQLRGRWRLGRHPAAAMAEAQPRRSSPALAEPVDRRATAAIPNEAAYGIALGRRLPSSRRPRPGATCR